jgi:type IV fimbrial biogenesis protein FimT
MRVARHKRRYGLSQPGFTLIELLVTIAVLAILIAAAVPSFTSLINANRLSTQANEMVATLQMARSEAVRLNTSVVVCRSTDGATCAAAGRWDRWITRVTSTGEVLRDTTVKAPVRVTSGGPASFTFRSDGRARNAAGGLLTTDFNVCVPTTLPAANQRLVRMASGSRVSVASSNGAGACPAL